jgi:hypothetical protein
VLHSGGLFTNIISQCFLTNKSLNPSLMFVCEARSLSQNGAPERYRFFTDALS